MLLVRTLSWRLQLMNIFLVQMSLAFKEDLNHGYE
jgi:hypothetical protein